MQHNFALGTKIKFISQAQNMTQGKTYIASGYYQNQPSNGYINVIMDNGSTGTFNTYNFEKEVNMLESVKEYLKENKQIIMTIAVVLIVDHLVFGGAFRERVKSLVNGLLNNAEKKLNLDTK